MEKTLTFENVLNEEIERKRRQDKRQAEIEQLKSILLSADKRKSAAIIAANMTEYRKACKEIDEVPAKIEAIQEKAAIDSCDTDALLTAWRVHLADMNKVQADRIRRLNELKAEYKIIFTKIVEEHAAALDDSATIKALVSGAVDIPEIPDHDRLYREREFVCRISPTEVNTETMNRYGGIISSFYTGVSKV